MDHFTRKDGELYAEGVRVTSIAEQAGTPCFIYSAAALRSHFDAYEKGFADAKHLVCYSVKANSNLAVLRVLANEGSGFDVVSGGELARVLAAAQGTSNDQRRCQHQKWQGPQLPPTHDPELEA